jgi:hypothetical protein
VFEATLPKTALQPLAYAYDTHTQGRNPQALHSVDEISAGTKRPRGSPESTGPLPKRLKPFTTSQPILPSLDSGCRTPFPFVKPEPDSRPQSPVVETQSLDAKLSESVKAMVAMVKCEVKKACEKELDAAWNDM